MLLLCEQPDGTLHPDELKNLIGLLQPDRAGFLSLAEFVQSVDSVYKEVKLIHAYDFTSTMMVSTAC